jgi:hypothetical protein
MILDLEQQLENSKHLNEMESRSHYDKQLRLQNENTALRLGLAKMYENGSQKRSKRRWGFKNMIRKATKQANAQEETPSIASHAVMDHTVNYCLYRKSQ